MMLSFLSASRFKCISYLLFISLFIACAEKEDQTSTGLELGWVTYSGTATKGPLSGAVISVYAMDARGIKTGSSLGQTTTVNGNWTISIENPNNALLLIESSGGEYIDESDPEPDITKKRKITLQSGEILRSVLVPGQATSAINFFTHMLVQTLRREVFSTMDLVQAFDRVRSRTYNILGFDPFTEIPTDPLQPDIDATAVQKTYALMIGGAAYAINNAALRTGATQITYQMIDLMARDLADCQLDGIIDNVSIIGLLSLPEGLYDEIDFNHEVLRFRNNHYDQYAEVSLPTWDDIAFCETNPILSLVLSSN